MTITLKCQKVRLINLLVHIFELQICQDICHGSKHVKLNKTATGDKNTDIKRVDIEIELGRKGAPPTKNTYWIESNGKEYNAFNLATKCKNLWEKFLKSENLL
ncbi:MAG: hypothetical protein ABEI53_01010 [Candidatus Magasanikbacteria bacterium]